MLASAVKWPQLDPGQVHIWLFPLRESVIPDALCWQWLDPVEKQRAERFRFTVHRSQFVRSHAQLRWVVSHYCQCSPENVRFALGAKGKPYLLQDQDTASPFSFNLAHSQDWAVAAISRGLPIGVDIEYAQRDVDHWSIAQRFFSGKEQAQLLAVAAAQRAEVFFQLWTLKEAYVKALGEGLRYHLNQFSVIINDLQSISVLDEARALAFSDEWLFQCWQPKKDYYAALATQGARVSITHFLITNYFKQGK